MVNWRSLEVELLCAMLYTKMVIFLLGAYSWFIVESWHTVEGALLTRRIKFALIHIPYLIARYGQLTTLALVCLLTQLPSPVVMSCEFIAIPRATVIVGNVTLVAASANIGLRAYTIWKGNSVVRIAMVLGCFGHLVYSVLMGVVTIQAIWSADHTECVLLTSSFGKVIIGFFIYSMIWDTFILLCTILGLRKALRNMFPSNNCLLHALKAQGVGYAVVTWLTSIPVTVVLLLNLNTSMNIFFSTPGATISVIASSKMVVSLLKLKGGESEEGASGPDSNLLGANSNLLTTNIHLTGFNPHSSGAESVSMREKNIEERQSDPPQKVVLEDYV